MLPCPACMRRCLRTLIGDIPQQSISSRSTRVLSSFGRASSARTYASFVANEKFSKDSSANISRFTDGSSSTPNTRQEWLESRGVRPTWKERSRESSDLDPQTAHDLRHLKDPLKLADYVRKKLQSSNFEVAQKIVRVASRDFQCVVSWNHLISWQLSNGSLNAALKTYNEMKKRAQFPDGHTYSIIFNGCAIHRDPNLALGKVLPIYHSMSSEKSSIKPTVIHVNALLKLCSRAMNTEALLAIVAEMPSKGAGSPNNLTYTTLFNALRFFATSSSRASLTTIQKRQNSEKALLEARHLWVDITKRWAQGDLHIDEELVSAFGRILILGGPRDVDDILSLIEQTMNIPRQIPPLASEARQAVDPRSRMRKSTVNAAADSSPEDLALEPPNGDDQIANAVHPGQRRGLFAKPGQNSLSVVLEALLKMQLKEPAQKYWQIFTTQYNVQPDQDNFHGYLRILRVARASNEAATIVIQKMSVQDLKHTTFRIAMATCRRDKLNKNAFANAGRLLDLMQSALREPDIPFLEEYLELAINAPAYSKRVSSSGKNDWSKFEQGKQILRALERLNPSLLNLKAHLHFADPQLAQKSAAERAEFVESIHSLTRKMISCYDLLMNKAMVPRDFYGPLTAQRGKLASFVARHKSVKQGPDNWNVKGKPNKSVKWSEETLAVLARPDATPSFDLFDVQPPSKSSPKDDRLSSKHASRIDNPSEHRRIAEAENGNNKNNASKEVRSGLSTVDAKQLPDKKAHERELDEQRVAA